MQLNIDVIEKLKIEKGNSKIKEELKSLRCFGNLSGFCFLILLKFFDGRFLLTLDRCEIL